LLQCGPEACFYRKIKICRESCPKPKFRATVIPQQCEQHQKIKRRICSLGRSATAAVSGNYSVVGKCRIAKVLALCLGKSSANRPAVSGQYETRPGGQAEQLCFFLADFFLEEVFKEPLCPG
jgi:hypothetical protein